MSGRIVDVPVETFTMDWCVAWRGPRRFAMLTSSLGDPSHFIAYGTDGSVAFRVEGSWRVDLSFFMGRMAADGVELLPPPPTARAFPPGHITFPDPLTVQRCFDARLGAVAA
ncbi:MAG TPA: hypothetical protein VIG99_26450 [Myxococcaceae bacterium]|jgi:hypothetical protein